MAEIGNKFIFTTEGRTSLVAQLGGIRFSVLGAILIQGLKPVEVSENKEDTTFEDAFKNLTLESLSLDNGVVLGLKNVDYNATGNQKIYPVNLDSYQSAFSNITQNLIPLHYVPAQEVEDTLGNAYGIYELDVDQTLLSCNFAGNDSDISFAHIGLIGKQYTQTDDATYNVDHTQKPILVGIAQLDGKYDKEKNVYEGGVQLLADQNQYVNIKLKLRFTLDERDRDIELDIDTENPVTSAVLDISNKLSLVNNGLKTKAKEGVKVASDKSIIENFNLNKEGALATDKTLMVAETYNADELENEWNGVGLIHLVNRENQEDDDENPYTPQVVLSTIEHYENLKSEPVVSYNVMMLLQGKGKDVPTINVQSKYEDIIAYANDAMGQETTGVAYQEEYFKINGTDCSKFVMSTKPEYDNIAVDIFGLNNNILDDGNPDKFLFTKNNVSHVNEINDKLDENIIIGGTDNLVDARHSNALINSWYNVVRNECEKNTIINSESNILQEFTDTCVVLNSNYNTFNINALLPDYEFDWWYDNIRLTTLINSCDNNIQKVKKSVLLNANNNLINASCNYIGETCEPSENINIIGGEYNTVYDCNNLYILGSYHNVLIDNDDYEDGINKRTLILGQNSDWEWRTRGNWKSRPGIIYGNGNEDGSNARNALEFFPDEGLLKLYDKSGNSTVTIGGDVGIVFPNSVNQTIEMTMKSLNVKDKISLDHENNHILLDATDSDPYISLINDDDTYTTELGSWYYSIERANGDATIINADTIDLHSNNKTKKTNISSSQWTIANTTTNKSVSINPGHVIITENGTAIDITADTNYQKVTADILITPTNGANYRCYVPQVINAHGNTEAVNWLKTLWEKYTPIAYGTKNNEQADFNYAGIICNNKRTLLDFNDSDSDLAGWFQQRLTTYDSYSNQLYAGINATLNRYRNGSNLFYYTTPLPNCFSCIDEVELNIYVGDAENEDISLVWLLGTILNPIYPYKAPTFKLNFILNYYEGVSNGEGEDLYVYTHKVYSDTTRGNPEHIQQKHLSLKYDNYITLLGKPANFTTPITQLSTIPGYLAWRVITEG